MNHNSYFLRLIRCHPFSFRQNIEGSLLFQPTALALLCVLVGGLLSYGCESKPPPNMETTGGVISPQETCDDSSEATGGVCAPEVCKIGLIREGEVCVVDVDLDLDLDGVPDAVDNCPDVANPPQSDCDLDEIGDLCDEERACGALLNGYVRLFQQGMNDSTPLRYGALELEGVPSLSLTDEFGQYTLRHLSAGHYSLIIYSPPSEETQELNSPTSPYAAPPLARFNFEITAPMLNDAMLRDWLIKPTGDLGGRITLEDVPSYEPKHELIGVYIEELPNLNVVTDPFGTFLLTGIPEGDYTLRIVRAGYEPTSLPVEVIGLTRRLITPPDEPLSLQVQANPMAHWTHELEVTLQEIHQEIDAVEVNLIPIFPHQTEEETLYLSRSAQRGDDLVFSSDPMPHDPHDVFTVQIRGQSLQGSRRFNVNAPTGETTRTELRARGYIPHEYAIVDFDQDGIPDDQDSDRDGDLCLNEEDLAPDDPFICQSIVANPSPSSPLNQVNTDPPLSLPVTFSTAQNGIWTLTDLSIIDPGEGGEPSSAVKITHAPLRYPLAHAFRETALTVVHPLFLEFDLTAIAPESVADLTIEVTDLTTPPDTLSLMMTRHPCTPLLNINATAEGACGVIEAPLEDCTQDHRGVYTCELHIQTEPLSQGAQPEFDTMSAFYRVWVYQKNMEPLMNVTPEVTCSNQCLNIRTSLDHLPIYNVIKRGLVTQPATCLSDASWTLLAEETADEAHCFPITMGSPYGEDPLSCISTPMLGAYGTPFVITKIQKETRIIPNAFYTVDVVFNPPSELWDIRESAVNPLFEARVILDLDTLSEDFNSFDYVISDGFTDLNGRLSLSHLSGTLDDPLPYCWGYDE